ncbi:MAG: helix-turn-helix transcriptional regulator [Clostridia bacterium]|nr:helix-turn-helix transcriptional regulator [Clostridia bacterium]
MERPITPQFRITSFIITFDRVFEPDYFFEGESHNYIEMVYCDSGTFEVTRDEKICLLNEGDLLFHAPMEFHCNRTAPQVTPRVVQLSFRHEGEMPLLLHEGVFPLNADEKETFFRIFRMADRYITDEKSDPLLGQEAAERLSGFILSLCRKKKAESRLSNTTGALAYQKVIRTMHEDAWNNYTLEDFAKKTYLSVSYIKSLFKRYAGVSPKIYYNTIRMNEAARMLSSGMSVIEAAEKLNFSSPNYLTALFKKHFNMTPSQYKKQGV